MDNTIKMAREVGKAIQADERYKAYHAAREVNDADTALQSSIGEFNLLRQKLSMEAGKTDDSKDQEAIDKLNSEAQAVYTQVMDNPNMKKFTAAKEEMDAMIRDVSTIISLCCDGEDPETCQIHQPSVRLFLRIRVFTGLCQIPHFSR